MPKKGRKSKGAVPPPKCKAILLCDQTIIEAGTGKISVIGIFEGFAVPQTPGVIRPFTVYLHLTDGIADHEYEISVELHDLKNDNVIARATGPKIRWGDRLSRLNLLIPVPPLKVEHAGVYDLVVLANKQEIDRQQFQVVIPAKPETKEEGEGND